MPPDNPLDINAIADSIGNELFPEDKSGTGEGTPPSAGSPTPPPVPPLTPDEFAVMPKAWKKEKEPLWSKLDREAREYIYARENDVLKGFEQYSTGHKSWNELISPFQAVIQQHPNVNPVQVMQNLMRNHLTILGASPEQKRVMAQNLLKSYGIDLGASAGPNPGAQTPPVTLPPEIQETLQIVPQLRDELGRFKAAEQERTLAENVAKVQAFAANPANKYFEEVTDDIMHFLQTGAAPTLEKAYEMAIWNNPAVRAKLLAEQAAGAPVPPKPPLNVNGTGGTPPTKPKTFEDSISSVMEKHYGAEWRNTH